MKRTRRFHRVRVRESRLECRRANFPPFIDCSRDRSRSFAVNGRITKITRERIVVFLLVSLRRMEGGLSPDPGDFFHAGDFFDEFEADFLSYGDMAEVFARLPLHFVIHEAHLRLILFLFTLPRVHGAIIRVKCKHLKRHTYEEINFPAPSKNLPLKIFRALMRLLIYFVLSDSVYSRRRADIIDKRATLRTVKNIFQRIEFG